MSEYFAHKARIQALYDDFKRDHTLVEHCVQGRVVRTEWTGNDGGPARLPFQGAA